MTVTFLRTVDNYRSGSSSEVSQSLGRGLIRLGHAYETSTVNTSSSVFPAETATRFAPKPAQRRKK